MGKTLAKNVSFIDPEDGFVTLEAGTKESDMKPSHVERITNPKAWDESNLAQDDDDFVKIPSGMTKEQFVAAAKANFDVSGEEVEHYDDLDSKKKDELVAVAEEEGVDLEGASTKADIINRIRAVRNAGDE